ncbi:hypothetical protein WL22_21440 [Burkholderia ubonensis]|nr:MoaD/ThiS family protein [Burkholderia ubonensis]AOK26452.1 hypothetical protein WK67_27720 [Burkholderia ubonensis]KVL22437.1 hypothetical protein WJ45_26280 [Burkholderia ubonensis]KVN85715.1 hypothetical protein WJ67_31260 [Burkholderia ubonensis]KVO40402.1 hypothetical protein WJ75_07515 [Burkholderia ubonensis]KVQ37944.1 hypothetical protein WK04_22455 [Burkholderia ubonensis]
MPTVIFPRQLRQFTAGNAKHETKTTAFRTILDEIFALYPGLVGPVALPNGEIQPFIGIFVSGRRVSSEDMSTLSIASDAEVAIISAVAGG